MIIFTSAKLEEIFKKKKKYKWSSYRFYVREAKEGLVDEDFLLAQFSNKKEIAKREYTRFVKSRISQGHRGDKWTGEEDS